MTTSSASTLGELGSAVAVQSSCFHVSCKKHLEMCMQLFGTFSSKQVSCFSVLWPQQKALFILRMRVYLHHLPLSYARDGRHGDGVINKPAGRARPSTCWESELICKDCSGWRLMKNQWLFCLKLLSSGGKQRLSLSDNWTEQLYLVCHYHRHTKALIFPVGGSFDLQICWWKGLNFLHVCIIRGRSKIVSRR